MEEIGGRFYYHQTVRDSSDQGETQNPVGHADQTSGPCAELHQRTNGQLRSRGRRGTDGVGRHHRVVARIVGCQADQT